MQKHSINVSLISYIPFLQSFPRELRKLKLVASSKTQKLGTCLFVHPCWFGGVVRSLLKEDVPGV